MSDQVQPIDQLWYTWSDIGLDTIRAGFRIRAASEGLHDIRNERVRKLDRYQRYYLPRGENPTLPVGEAPVCLSLVRDEDERILVHKVYTGRDMVGRYGAFSVHLLASLPNEAQKFSARDAISLWRSPFWQRFEVTSDQYSTDLKSLLLSELKQEILPPDEIQAMIPPGKRNIERLRSFLPYVIQAYLVKKSVDDAPRKLYLFGSDDDIALLILGLTYCLPLPIIQRLTFSTYEHDIFEATTELVGSCQPSFQEDGTSFEEPFPEWLHSEVLSLNCYTGKYSPLEIRLSDGQENPFVLDRPLAASYATYATRYFLDGDSEFQTFLEGTVENCADVDRLLEQFKNHIVNLGVELTQQEVEFQLQGGHGYSNAAQLLAKPNYQDAILKYLREVPAARWQTFGKQVFINLNTLSQTIPALVRPLEMIKERVITYVVGIAIEDATHMKTASQASVSYQAQQFKRMLDVLLCLPLREPDSATWLSLLRKLVDIHNIMIFFSRYWEIYTILVTIWCKIPIASLKDEDKERITKILSFPWGRLGEFLTLRTPHMWTEVAIEQLLTTPLDPETAVLLHTRYSHELERLFFDFANDALYWLTALDLFRVIERGNPDKISLLFKLCDLEISGQAEFVGQLLQAADPNSAEQTEFLLRYGPTYLPLFNSMSLVILDVLTKLAQSDAQRKMEVLLSWLKSEKIVTWLSLRENNLSVVLNRVNLNENECVIFFQEHGKTYIPRYPQSTTLIKLFGLYARSPRENRQNVLNVLNIWLSLRLDLEQDTLEQLLLSTSLRVDEQIVFLLEHGRHYIPLYPQSQVLRGYIITLCKQLWVLDINTFRNNASAEPSNLEYLFSLLRQLYPHASLQWNTWYTIARFVREPLIRVEKPQEIAESIGRLFDGYTQQNKHHEYTKLSQLLVSACLKDEKQLEVLMDMFSRVFNPVDLMLLLYEIAATVRERAAVKKQPRTLLLSCINCALQFKKAFLEEEEQTYFVQIFLQTLLFYSDKKTLEWLSVQVRNQYPRLSHDEWKNYITEVSFETDVLTYANRFLLWQEYMIAYVQLQRVLRSNNPQRIARVSTDFKTILLNSDNVLPEEWWKKIQEAERVVLLNNPSSAPAQEVVLKGMYMALNEGYVGKIVRVALEHGLIGNADPRIPESWRKAIQAAFAFFTACMLATGDVVQEQAIVAAYTFIDDLTKKQELVPWLTEHEKRRVELARHRVAHQKIQSTQEQDKQWIRDALVEQDVTKKVRIGIKMPAPVSGFRKLSNWFKKTFLFN